MNDIAVAVGSDRASLYYYYASKQELFLDVVRRALDELAALAEEVAASPGPAPEQLRRLVRGQLDAYERHYPCLHLYLQEDVPRIAALSTKVGRDLHRLAQRCEKALAGIISDGIARGELRPDLDPRLIATAITGAVSWSHRWFKPGGRASGAAVGEAYAEIMLHGITSSPAAVKRARRPPAGR